MSNKFNAFLQKILNFGITDDTSWSLSNKIQIANSLVIIAFPLISLNVIINIFQRDVVGLSLCAIWTILAGLILILSKRKLYFANFVYIVCLITLMSNFVLAVIGQKGNISPMYMLTILMVLFFFDKRKHVIFFISFIILNYIAINYVLLNYDTVLKTPTVPERHLYFTFSTIIMIAITLRVVLENRKQIKETETLLKKVEQKNKEMERFAYITSHDLKEPIRNIASFSSLLSRKLKDSSDEEVQEYLSFIKSGAVQLNTMADAVMEFVNISNPSDKEFTTVEFKDIIQKATENLSKKIKTTNTQVKCVNSVKFKGIENQLIILFQHLMDNAIKFNNNSTPMIHIEVVTTPIDNIFIVEDNGIGIESDYFERIFMPFKKLHNKSEYEGAGIGLAICQRIAELHDGYFRIESKIGEGTSFRLSIPHDEYNG